MAANFNDLINKINNIESNNFNNTDIIIETIKTIANEYNIDDSIIIKFSDLNNLNKKFFEIHTKKCIEQNKFCVICQHHMKKREHKIKLIKCSHCFHKKCLNKYFKIKKLNFSCPICQQSYKTTICDIIKDTYQI